MLKDSLQFRVLFVEVKRVRVHHDQESSLDNQTSYTQPIVVYNSYQLQTNCSAKHACLVHKSNKAGNASISNGFVHDSVVETHQEDCREVESAKHTRNNSSTESSSVVPIGGQVEISQVPEETSQHNHKHVEMEHLYQLAFLSEVDGAKREHEDERVDNCIDVRDSRPADVQVAVLYQFEVEAKVNQEVYKPRGEHVGDETPHVRIGHVAGHYGQNLHYVF